MADETAVLARQRSSAPPTRPRHVPWDLAALALLAMVLLAVLRLSAAAVDNQDTWFHLALGDHFRTGSWSLSDPGGLTRFATSDWVPTQWSTQVLASALDNRFGLPAVALLFGCLMLAAILSVFISCRRQSGPGPAAIVTTLMVVASAPVLSARPQIVSLLLLSLTTAAWVRTYSDGRVRWWLVPVTYVWATAHGLWSIGLVVAAFAYLGLLLDRVLTKQEAVRGGVIVLLCVGSTMATPVGPKLLTSQFAVSERSSMIAEWGPTSFRDVSALSAALLIGAVVVLWARSGRVSWTHILLLVVAAGMTLLVTRLVPCGAVVAAPILAAALQETVMRKARTPMRGLERLGIVALAGMFVVGLALTVGNSAAQPGGVPLDFETRISALPANSSLLVEDGVGSWVEWQHPEVDPVIDGMLDAYPVEYIQDFFDFKNLEPGWQGFVARSGAREAVMLKGSPATAALQDQLGWRIVQRDLDWVYLEAPPAAP